MTHDERRKHVRVRVRIPATIGVMVPEATFQPRMHQATVLDLSEKGAMLHALLSEETYRELLQGLRYCRLTFTDEPRLPSRLIGSAVYFQPISHPSHRTEYRMGLFFDEISASDQDKLRTFIERIAAEETR